MLVTYIALLRGVNAGGANTLPTKVFASLLEKLGFENIRTYIQTGNAVFASGEKNAGKLAEKIKNAVNANLGFLPEVVVSRLEEFEKAVKSNPFPEADHDHKSLHLAFLVGKADSPDLSILESHMKESERFKLDGGVLYFHAPEGVGRSKAFSKIEKSLGVPVTARNWRTVKTLLGMAKGTGDSR